MSFRAFTWTMPLRAVSGHQKNCPSSFFGPAVLRFSIVLVILTAFIAFDTSVRHPEVKFANGNPSSPVRTVPARSAEQLPKLEPTKLDIADNASNRPDQYAPL